ncbi:double-strand break repair protein AddB [Sphingomonas sp. 1P06PA]|uniref:double-strand break repair protein AddB n=1 Tax=Sphingomonas sp. 1P06PA TaxID=554121 RepID=UPI0039A74C13
MTPADRAAPLRPAVFTIPAHRAFADALAAGLIARTGGDRMALARAMLLLPTNRAVRAVTDAFVRRSEGGLLLPRLVAIGDAELGDALGLALDPADAEPVPPAVDPLDRLMRLARLVQQARDAAGDPIDAAEALRLAGDLARVRDQLLVEEVPPERLADAVPVELSRHWEGSLAILRAVLDRWPAELTAIGRIDLAERRARLLAGIERRWATTPPAGLVVAAGITTSAPAIARLLRRIARLPQGMVVVPALDLAMPVAEWSALGPHDPDPTTGIVKSPIETHPQFQLKLLIDAIGVARGEVRPWRWGGGRGSAAVRSRAIGNAMAPARFTAKWQTLPPAERRLSGIVAAEFAGPGEEARAIAIAMREAIETPGRTAALVTPDRGLAQRVAAQLRRWAIHVDDSAGRPLSQLPPGTLLLSLAAAAAERFAPVALLALLKHPLVRRGDRRDAWLAGVRALDRALRGPRPDAGLAGVTAHLDGGDERERKWRRAAAGWWDEARALLAPLESLAAGASTADRLAVLRDVASALCGDAVWAGPDGRRAAALIAELEAVAAEGPVRVDGDGLHRMLRQLMDDIAIRPPQGGHPRLFIWGLIEAQLQQADLMILGGLNEGVWPALPAPDPWLAPALRRSLGLPGLERRIGLAAHDFASALGAPRVILTRARRDARAPVIASRFWLRLEAMTGGVTRLPRLRRWADAIDRPIGPRAPASQPAPSPPSRERPRRLAVTDLDRLKADPYAFYAKAMLGLSRLDPVDADPSAAWRGSAVHAVFEAWMIEDGCRPDRLVPRARDLLDRIAAHPVLRALWTPRLIEALEWVAARMADDVAAGRVPIAAERKAVIDIAGVTISGKVDRVDRLPGGGLAIVDYKTGKAPAKAQIDAGFALQLGLLGLIAEQGGIEGIAGWAEAFEYWSLAKERDGFGKASAVDPEGFLAFSERVLREAIAKWLTGDEPFTAKLNPDFAPFDDYDQLMRLDEWYGAER